LIWGNQQNETDAPFKTMWQLKSTKAIYVTTNMEDKIIEPNSNKINKHLKFKSGGIFKMKHIRCTKRHRWACQCKLKFKPIFYNI